ncbi:MAG: tetratricopeptide repeat protein [Bacteroidetes bacterium]|nr:tetratricopeptide repeat protein [Bacteroidota bacterium]
MRSPVSIVFFSLIISYSFAQRSANMDSILHSEKTYTEIVVGLRQNFSNAILEKALSEEEDDKVKVKFANALCWKYFSSEPRKALDYAKMQTELAEKTNDKDALETGYDNFGFLYQNFGENEKSISYLLKSLAIKEEKKDSSGISVCLNGIGGLYFRMEKFPQALGYMLRTYKLDSTLGNTQNLPAHNGNIGVCYANMNQYDKALKYYLLSEQQSKYTGQKSSSANLLNTGIAYLQSAHYEKSREYLIRALASAKENKEVSEEATAHIQFAELYSAQKNFNEAIRHGEKALAIARENNLKEEEVETSNTLAKVYAGMGNFQKAYDYHKLYSDVKDSVLNEESGKQIAEMQTKYETEKKEQQIQLLNKEGELQKSEVRKQKIIIWSVVSGLLIVVLLSLFIIKERRKSEKLLLNILPAETARELKAKGKATATHYEHVTVMFTDFKDFTTIAEKLSAEELVSELDFLFRKFDEIISKYPIEKIKTIGDAYMCAGGLPTANSTNAMDVVSAALEIQEWMMNGYRLSVNSNRSNTGNRLPITDYWQLRIGIHTGAVTAGVVGDKKFAYDIWGDAVNTASRMESSGEAGKINISGATFTQLNSLSFWERAGVRADFRGKIPAKNKGEIDMYFVERNKT